MKTTLPKSLFRFPRIAAMALLGALIAVPATTADARPRRSARAVYLAHPSSGFVLSFGTGYAGRGYYWGPPNAGYYYERPGVRFYRNRADYRPGPDRGYGRRESTDAAVQRALARLGFYRGPIDGDIGPGTRRAIARYEASRGLPVRGYVTRGLLNALRIR